MLGVATTSVAAHVDATRTACAPTVRRRFDDYAFCQASANAGVPWRALCASTSLARVFRPPPATAVAVRRCAIWHDSVMMRGPAALAECERAGASFDLNVHMTPLATRVSLLPVRGCGTICTVLLTIGRHLRTISTATENISAHRDSLFAPWKYLLTCLLYTSPSPRDS